MQREPLWHAVEALVSRRTGRPVEVIALEPLIGGACQDNFRVDLRVGDSERRVVLRSDARTSLPGSLSRRGEFRVIEAAVMASVKTPPVYWLCEDLVRPMSSAFFMDFAEGQTIAQGVLHATSLSKARDKLCRELAFELAKIHRITPASAPHLKLALPGDPAAAALRHHRAALDQVPEPHPAIELALRWLSKNRPSPRPITLCHGDFRTGNFAVTRDGLGAVLDWEFAHWGDPMDDLGWACVRDWRFGNLGLPAFGIASRAELLAAYEEASGIPADPADVYYWELMGNVRCAIGALHQGERYLSGSEHDIELLAISKRVPEIEYEILRLLKQAGAS